MSCLRKTLRITTWYNDMCKIKPARLRKTLRIPSNVYMLACRIAAQSFSLEN
uniref:Predicted protein n=1 Tax=Hordeum vulgare subsp. vulgare TaxID=112509 RepID=F2DXU3_HORVV|nr:predicted protein [Hordeum vulgare subsp. vulgare]